MENLKILEPNNKNLPFVLTKLIASTGLDLPSFCKKIDIKYTTIYQIINGGNTNPRMSTLLAILRFFNIRLEQLIGEEPLHENIVTSNIKIEKNDKNAVWQSDLYLDCIKKTSKVLKKFEGELTINHFLDVANEAYHYAISKKLDEADSNFIEWFYHHHLSQ
ncbi:helix-turn-helix domain-containing protein [Cysteiniphilum litorale]|uniref:helix-turn-helix domain-containing protein n=1 Tax=Cysteiniphilum litorale TaxID=2056700 RepID=UPI003F883A28